MHVRPPTDFERQPGAAGADHAERSSDEPENKRTWKLCVGLVRIQSLVVDLGENGDEKKQFVCIFGCEIRNRE